MIDGIATLTIVASTMIITTPIVTATRASQRLRSSVARGQALVLCYPLAAGAQCSCGGVIRPRLVVALSAVSRGA